MNAAPSKTKPSKKPQPATPVVSKTKGKDGDIHVVESGSCPTLTGKSTLGYDVGRDPSDALHLRIRSNSGNGRFSKDFLPLQALMDALGKAKPPITSGTFRAVCRAKSANQAPFLLAVFAHKGLVQRLPGKLRGFALGPTFQAGATQLTKPAAPAPSSSKPKKEKAVAKSSKK
jgi:hypothetical protein